jgi:acetate kinase
VVGHRIAHGGQRFSQPTPITRAVRAAARSLSASAPLHDAAALEGVAAAEAFFGASVPQVECSTPPFHSGLPATAHASTRMRGRGCSRGLRRFGFHGISHE